MLHQKHCLAGLKIPTFGTFLGRGTFSVCFLFGRRRRGLLYKNKASIPLTSEVSQLSRRNTFRMGCRRGGGIPILASTFLSVSPSSHSHHDFSSQSRGRFSLQLCPWWG